MAGFIFISVLPMSDHKKPRKTGSLTRKRRYRILKRFVHEANKNRLRWTYKTAKKIDLEARKRRTSIAKSFKIHKERRLRRSVLYLSKHYSIKIQDARVLRNNAIKRNISYKSEYEIERVKVEEIEEEKPEKVIEKEREEEIEEEKLPYGLLEGIQSYFDVANFTMEKEGTGQLDDSTKIIFDLPSIAMEGDFTGRFEVTEIAHAMDRLLKERYPSRWYMKAPLFFTRFEFSLTNFVALHKPHLDRFVIKEYEDHEIAKYSAENLLTRFFT
jgi:hypothetical protein